MGANDPGHEQLSVRINLFITRKLIEKRTFFVYSLNSVLNHPYRVPFQDYMRLVPCDDSAIVDNHFSSVSRNYCSIKALNRFWLALGVTIDEIFNGDSI